MKTSNVAGNNRASISNPVSPCIGCEQKENGMKTRPGMSFERGEQESVVWTRTSSCALPWDQEIHAISHEKQRRNYTPRFHAQWLRAVRTVCTNICEITGSKNQRLRIGTQKLYPEVMKGI